MPIKKSSRTSFQFNILLIFRNPSIVIESSHAFTITSDILITQGCDPYFERSKRNKLTMLRLLTRIQLDVWSTRNERRQIWLKTNRQGNKSLIENDTSVINLKCQDWNIAGIDECAGGQILTNTDCLIDLRTRDSGDKRSWSWNCAA